MLVGPSPLPRPCQWPGQGGVARRGLGAAHCGSGEYQRLPQLQKWPLPPAPSAFPDATRRVGSADAEGAGAMLSQLRARDTARTTAACGRRVPLLCACLAQLARLPRASQGLPDRLACRDRTRQPRRDHKGLPGWKATRRGSGDLRSGGRVRLISQEIRSWEGGPSAVSVRVLDDAGRLCQLSR